MLAALGPPEGCEEQALLCLLPSSFWGFAGASLHVLFAFKLSVFIRTSIILGSTLLNDDLILTNYICSNHISNKVHPEGHMNFGKK